MAHIRRRSRGRKGLEAIFSSQESGREREVLVGAVGILSGLFLSVLAIFRTDAPQALGPLVEVVYSPLAFGGLGSLLLICGGGTLVFVFVHRESRRSNGVASTINGHVGVDGLGNAMAQSETQGMFGPDSRMGAVAFVQSLLLVALYSGFVQEFESNLTMQIWVRSNFPVGQSVLNWEGVLILSVCLGLLLPQFLPGRFFSE